MVSRRIKDTLKVGQKVTHRGRAGELVALGTVSATVLFEGGGQLDLPREDVYPAKAPVLRPDTPAAPAVDPGASIPMEPAEGPAVKPWIAPTVEAEIKPAIAPAAETPPAGKYRCDFPGCDRDFDTYNGLGPHRRKAHNITGGSKRPTPKPMVAPEPTPETQPVTADDHAVDAAYWRGKYEGLREGCGLMLSGEDEGL